MKILILPLLFFTSTMALLLKSHSKVAQNNFNYTIPLPNATLIPPTLPSNNTGLIRSVTIPQMNLTIDLSIPVFYPPIIKDSGNFWWYSLIPPEFWVSPSPAEHYIALKNNDKEFLSCNTDGKIEYKNPDVQPRNLWIPELVVDDVIALRSYFGGYLYLKDNQVHCDSRLIQINNRFQVKVQSAVFTNNGNNNNNNNNNVHNSTLQLQNLNGEFLLNGFSRDSTSVFFASNYGQEDENINEQARSNIEEGEESRTQPGRSS